MGTPANSCKPFPMAAALQRSRASLDLFSLTQTLTRLSGGSSPKHSGEASYQSLTDVQLHHSGKLATSCCQHFGSCAARSLPNGARSCLYARHRFGSTRLDILAAALHKSQARTVRKPLVRFHLVELGWCRTLISLPVSLVLRSYFRTRPTDLNQNQREALGRHSVARLDRQFPIVKSRVYSASRKQTALPDGVWLSRGPLCCLSDYADDGCRIKRVHSAELQVRARVQLLEPPGTTGGSGA